jgi:surfeit locus 1 family protein
VTEQTPAPRRSLILLSGFAGLGMVVLCSLGAWQLQRLAEKAAFLERLAVQKALTPAALPAEAMWGKLDLDASDLARVRLAGTWLPDASATVRVVMPEPQPGERKLGGFGRYLVTAVRLDTGGIVLVNRGFAPEARHVSLPPPSGRAELTGILRKPEAPNAFTPAADAGRRDFHMRDPVPIADAMNLSAAPFMIEAERGADAMTPPVGVDFNDLIARIPNNHLQYAFTWFGLAATLLGVFMVFARSLRRQAG